MCNAHTLVLFTFGSNTVINKNVIMFMSMSDRERDVYKMRWVLWVVGWRLCSADVSLKTDAKIPADLCRLFYVICLVFPHYCDDDYERYERWQRLYYTYCPVCYVLFPCFFRAPEAFTKWDRFYERERKSTWICRKNSSKIKTMTYSFMRIIYETSVTRNFIQWKILKWTRFQPHELYFYY